MAKKLGAASGGGADSASAYRASIVAAVRAVLTANKDGVLLRSETISLVLVLISIMTLVPESGPL